MAKKKTFGSGALVLGSTGLLCSAIGCVFRIILANLIGQNGIAYYQMVYPLYSVLTVIASVGIPAAISRPVAHYLAMDDRDGANLMFKTAFWRLCLAGAAATAALCVFAKPLAALQGMAEAYRLYYLIAPCVLLTVFIACLRGWFQGVMMMGMTATSQLIEELGKTVLGLAFALFWRKLSPINGAFGAILGIPIAEAGALFYLLIGRLRAGRRRKTRYRITTDMSRARALGRGIGLRSLPVILGACIQPIILLIDNLLVVPMLRSMGFSVQTAQARFGLVSGMINPVAFIASSVGVAIAMSLVPTIAASAALRRRDEVERNAAAGLKVTLLVALPCMAGLMLVGPALVRVLFRLSDPDSMAAAGTLMRSTAVSFFMLMLAQTATAILQGVNHVRRPAVHLCIGTAAKLGATWLLLRVLQGDIAAVGYGTLIGFTVTAALDLYSCAKIVHVRLDPVMHLVRPVFATLFMAVAVATVYFGLSILVGESIAAFIGVLVGLITYPFAILRLQAVSSEDCRLLPHGIELEYFMHRIGWWI